MAFLGPFNAAVVNPSLVTLAKDFHKTTTVISYSTTVSIIMGGLSVRSSPLALPMLKDTEIAEAVHIWPIDQCVRATSYHPALSTSSCARQHWISSLNYILGSSRNQGTQRHWLWWHDVRWHGVCQ